MKAQRGSKYIALLFPLALSLRGRWVFNATLRPLDPPGKRPGTRYTGGWVGHKASVGFDPQIVQSLPSLCTDWAIAAH